MQSAGVGAYRYDVPLFLPARVCARLRSSRQGHGFTRKTPLDVRFHVCCRQGYALGLDQAARGMGLPGKPPGMSGEMAPKYWKAGRRQEVLAYVAQDGRTTLDLATRVDQQGRLQWKRKTGRLKEA